MIRNIEEMDREIEILRKELASAMSNIAQLVEQRANLEKEAEWLAQAAANAAWHDMRVSAADMREKARQACGKPGQTPFLVTRSEYEIARVEKWAFDGCDAGSFSPELCYEDGLIDMLEWLRGDVMRAPDED